MATRQTRRQLQFTGLEMAAIAVSFVVTVTAVFFLGLFVGRKNASMHAPAEDRVARVPVDDFTKYKRPAPIPAPPKPERPAAAAAAPAASSRPASPASEASEAAAKAAVPAVASPAAPMAPADAAKAAPPADTAARDAAAASAKAREAAAKEAATKEAAAKEAAKDKEKEDEATGRGYTVQILATRKQADADALVAKLKSRGYAAYIKKVSDGAGAWYRVRVGSYGAFSEARAMADRCRRDLGLGQAFVSTE